MRFGLFGINIGVCAAGRTAAEIAQVAETAGFESVWTGEHVVLPDPQVPPSPGPPDTAFLDPAIALALGAAPTAARARPLLLPPADARDAVPRDAPPHPARHRHHHLAAAQSGGARQGV